MCHDIERVYLPLETLGKCQVCKEKSADKLCSACGERSYCSEACQKVDWKQHKLTCAWMHASSHWMTTIKPLHPAHMAKITNNANPDVPTIEFPDGWCARLVMLDDTLPSNSRSHVDPMDWFPLAQSLHVARKLLRRITYGGHLLPILTAIATALFTEMYTTTSGVGVPECDQRVRLRYRSMPISDFGIAAGSVRVTSQDRLAFCKRSDGSIFRGPDPDDHYWLYFTTAKGEEVILECGMFPFNMCQVVDTDPYVPPHMEIHPDVDVRMGFVPTFLIERTVRKNALALHTERKQISMLRNSKLQEAVKVFAKTFLNDANEAVNDTEVKPFYDFMEELSGRPLSNVDKSMFKRLTPIHCYSMHYVLCQKEWKKFPEEPQLGIDGDSGELDDLDTWSKKHKQWKKQQKAQKKDSRT